MISSVNEQLQIFQEMTSENIFVTVQILSQEKSNGKTFTMIIIDIFQCLLESFR